MFEVGQKVRLLNENGEGVISKLLKDCLWVDVDGFEYKYNYDEVILVGADNSVLYNAREFRIEEKVSVKSGMIKVKMPVSKNGKSILLSRLNEKGIPEVDLHLHELLDSSHQFSNHEKLGYQLAYLEFVLKEAYQNNIKELIVIHGVGEGILKANVRKKLDEKQGVEYWDAALKKYGWGATHIRLYKK